MFPSHDHLVSYDGEKLVKSADGCRIGFFDYNDDATSTTPISVTGGAGYVTLTNDELGPNTVKTYAPEGVIDVWDASNDRFNFSDLKLGDQLTVRIDIEVTTSSANQVVDVALELGSGGSPYDLKFISTQYKTAGAHDIAMPVDFYMGNANTLNNYGLIKIQSDDDCDVVVRGWYCKVLIKG